MTLGYRTRLLLISLALLLVGALLSGWYLERALGQWLIARTRHELEAHAHTCALVLRQASPSQDLDQLAVQLGEATGARVTVIGVGGVLWGDSVIAREQLSAAAPIAIHTPALEGLSALDALPAFEAVTLADGRPAHVRVMMPLDELEHVVERVRLLMVCAVLMGLVAAVLMSGLASHFTTRTLRALVRQTQQRLRPNASQEDAWDADDALGGLTTSITALSEAMSEAIAQLASERDQFEAVLEGMEEAVFALDQHHQITLMNAAAQALFTPQLDAHDGDPRGARITALIPIPALITLLERADQGARSAAELTLLGPPQRQVMAHITPRQNARGSVLVLHDVTTLRKLEQVRSDFVANVSHELRTPVSVIMLNSELLLEHGLDDPLQARRFIEAMARNAERLSQLISDLLDISRLEAGKFRLEREPVSAFGAVVRVIDALEARADARAQSLEVDIDLELLIYADARALDQILYNLIDNAIKYSPEAGALLVRAQRERGKLPEGRASVLIEVCDQGAGLTPEQRTRIFERFYRVDDGRSRDQGGTGLGLAIVKHLAQALEGRVGVRANTPRGSIFWVRLPAASPRDATAIDVATTLEEIA